MMGEVDQTFVEQGTMLNGKPIGAKPKRGKKPKREKKRKEDRVSFLYSVWLRSIEEGLKEHEK